ncbi:MAG: UDP-N-acetylmuramate dehydrogenase [Candidatus Gottesmanbacteria bacterium]
MTDQYKQFIETIGIPVKEQEELASYTTYKVGGPADLFVEARTTRDIIDAVTMARVCTIPFFILGGGSNILIGDKGFRGLVIKNMTKTITVRGMKGAITKGISDGSVYVEAESGVPFNNLVRYTIEEGLQGLEMHLGLPGSVGGALFMNSKWTRPPACVGDVVYQATLLTPTGEVKAVSPEYFHFSYGSSGLQKSGDIVLSVIFALKRSNKEALWMVANESISYRKDTQPQGVKTAGCVFKNISLVEAVSAGTPDHTTSAGYLIDNAGCKNFSVGDAAVSPVHANFIVNTGKATSHDMIQLIDQIKEQVRAKFGVALVEEVLRVGDF